MTYPVQLDMHNKHASDKTLFMVDKLFIYMK